MVPLRACAALVASWMFGMAIVPGHGGYSDAGVTWVILGLLVVGALFWSTTRDRSWGLPEHVVARVAWVGLCVLSAFGAWQPRVLLYAVDELDPGQFTRWIIFAVILTYGLSFVRVEAPWVRHLRFGVLAVLIGVMGVQTIRASPAPLIDVWTVQQAGAASLLHGGNPFQDVHRVDTGPRDATDVPYVYPPLQLYVSTVAYALTGDVRYSAVLALLLLGFATRALARQNGTRPAILEDAPALLIWCTPMLAFLIEQGWIDPVQVAWCSALLLAWGRPWLAAVLAGLVLGAKQTMALLVVPVGLAMRLNLRQWLLVGLVALIPLLPWLLWDFDAYKHANFDFLNALPVRKDALTVAVWTQRRLGLTVPYGVGFALAAIVLAVAAQRGKQSRDRTTIAVLTAMTFFFAFNKWAFANYYFTLLTLAAMAAATGLNVAANDPLSFRKPAAQPP